MLAMVKYNLYNLITCYYSRLLLPPLPGFCTDDIKVIFFTYITHILQYTLWTQIISSQIVENKKALNVAGRVLLSSVLSEN